MIHDASDASAFVFLCLSFLDYMMLMGSLEKAQNKLGQQTMTLTSTHGYKRHLSWRVN